LPAPAVLREVALGEHGVKQGKKTKILIDLSTTGSKLEKEVAAALRHHGITLIDAPVSGGATGAEKGTLAVMVAGKPTVVAGLRIGVVPGEVAARFHHSAVRRDPHWRDCPRLIVIDIGGGSTEIIQGEAGTDRVAGRISVNLGAVAAAVQVQNAQSSLDVQVFADDVMKLPGLEAIEDLKQGSVNADFMNDLSLLAVRLTSAMTSPDGAKIQPTAVKLARIDQAEYSPLNSAISGRSAGEKVRRTRPPNNPTNRVKANGNYRGLLVPAIAAAGYSCFGVETYEATPTSDQVSAAQSLQTCGWW